MLTMLKKLKNNDLAVGISRLSIGTTISQAILISSAPIISRLYTPEYFGVNAVYLSILNIVVVIAALKYDSAIVVADDEKDANNLYWLGFSSTIFVSLLSMIALVVITTLCRVKIYNVFSQLRICVFQSLSILFLSFININTSMGNREKRYGVLLFFPIIQSSVLIATNVLIGLLGNKEYGLITGNVISLFSAALFLLIAYKLPQRPRRLCELKTISVKYKEFPLLLMPSNIINVISTQMPAILLTGFFSADITGQFALSQRVLQLPVIMLGQAVAQVYYRKMVEIKDDLQKIGDITWKLIKVSFLLISLPMLLIICFGDVLFSFVFGSNWNMAGIFSQALAPWFIMVFIMSPLTTLLIVLNKQRTNLIINIVMIISRLATLLLGPMISSNPLFTILLYGLTGTIIWYLVSLFILKISGNNIGKFIKYSILFVFLYGIIFLLSRLIR